MERLVVEPEPSENMRPEKAARFVTRLERTGELMTISHQPLVDGARRMLALGFEPETPLTMRHASKAFDSFTPMPIRYWAGWTYSESGSHPLRQRVWEPRTMPVADDGEGQK